MNDISNRAEETFERRRRRDDSYNGYDLRLEVPEHLKDPAYIYRWINDDKGRLSSRTTQDDWDFVEDPNIASHTDPKNKNESDSRIRREVGLASNGHPLFAYLCRKRRKWVEEDFRKEMNAVKARQAGVLKNQDAGGDGTLAKDDAKHSYIPREIQQAIGVTEAKIKRASPRRE